MAYSHATMWEYVALCCCMFVHTEKAYLKAYLYAQKNGGFYAPEKCDPSSGVVAFYELLCYPVVYL